MGNPSSYRIAGVAIAICLVIAGFITLIANTPQDHDESEKQVQTVTKALATQEVRSEPVNHTGTVTNQIRVLWYDDIGRTYTFHDYEREPGITPGTWASSDLPSPENGTQQKKAAMIRFLEWDGSVERMTGTKYLINQEMITNILNSYTLIAPPPPVQPTPITTTTPSITQPTSDITPTPGMLIPTSSHPCNNGEGIIQVSFGYINRQKNPVSVTIGEKNRFTPGESDRGQPTTFLPGIHQDVFSVRFPANGTNVAWNLMEKTVGAGEVPRLHADFVVDPVSGYAPLDVRVTDQSIGGTPEDPLSGNWNFGDGTTADGSSATHRYEFPGKYEIRRSISTSCGSEISEKILSVERIACTIDPVSGSSRMYQCTDLSTGKPTVWFWDFNDGFSSWDQNPIHTWKSPGTYAVSLTVSGKTGSGTTVKKITIQ